MNMVSIYVRKDESRRVAPSITLEAFPFGSVVTGSFSQELIDIKN